MSFSLSFMTRVRRCGPAITRSMASSRARLSMSCAFERAVSSAASLSTFARSAPVKPGRLAREHLEVDALGERLALGVHLEDLLAALEVGRVDADLAVEAARAQQRGVEDVGAVRRRDDDDVGLRVEAVHLDEQLVEGLLALVVPAAESGAAVTADGVDLVDEDDGRRVLLGLVEQVAHAAWRRRRRTSRRSPSRRSSRTARRPHPRPRGRAGSCRFREGRRAARPWGCARRRPGTSRAPSGTP